MGEGHLAQFSLAKEQVEDRSRNDDHEGALGGNKRERKMDKGMKETSSLKE